MTLIIKNYCERYLYIYGNILYGVSALIKHAPADINVRFSKKRAFQNFLSARGKISFRQELI